MEKLAIRREDKVQERRSPIAPSQLPQLAAAGVEVFVQPSAHRIFSDEEFANAGARIVEELPTDAVVCGIKEVALEKLEEGRTYLCFSHTIKGQRENMPLLRRVMQLGCTMIDYERIVDDQGQRLVFFGRFAGLAGMIDSLWALGQRVEGMGHQTPLAELLPAHRYETLAEAEAELSRIGAALKEGAWPEPLRPLVVGVAGTGNTGKGAGHILDVFGACRRPTDQLPGISPGDPNIYQVFFDVHHLVARHDGKFDLAEYFKYPYRYRSIFDRQLPHLTVLMNCIYWENRYPRLVTIRRLNALYSSSEPPRLQVIGDIACDVRGAVEATVRATWSDAPVYVFDVDTGQANSEAKQFCGHGPAIMAVYNLPAELPRDASVAFGQQLMPYMAGLAKANLGQPSLADTQLPKEVERAVVVYRGEICEDYGYLEQFL
jgi:alanine dehydrogenase